MSNNYAEKYLKYKNKYINLKKQYGGGDDDLPEDVQLKTQINNFINNFLNDQKTYDRDLKELNFNDDLLKSLDKETWIKICKVIQDSYDYYARKAWDSNSYKNYYRCLIFMKYFNETYYPKFNLTEKEKDLTYKQLLHMV
jgi:hypothetical protein